MQFPDMSPCRPARATGAADEMQVTRRSGRKAWGGSLATRSSLFQDHRSRQPVRRSPRRSMNFFSRSARTRVNSRMEAGSLFSK
jgi:hypothetical protein